MVLHEPRLDTVLMVEKAVIDSEEHPKKMELWRSLPKQVQYQTFQRILKYLEATGRIAFNSHKIIYTGADSPKLKALIETSIRVR